MRARLRHQRQLACTALPAARHLVLTLQTVLPSTRHAVAAPGRSSSSRGRTRPYTLQGGASVVPGCSRSSGGSAGGGGSGGSEK